MAEAAEQDPDDRLTPSAAAAKEEPFPERPVILAVTAAISGLIR
jgi:hypothetical protein